MRSDRTRVRNLVVVGLGFFPGAAPSGVGFAGRTAKVTAGVAAGLERGVDLAGASFGDAGIR
jgi:hypothetical protein